MAATGLLAIGIVMVGVVGAVVAFTWYSMRRDHHSPQAVQEASQDSKEE